MNNQQPPTREQIADAIEQDERVQTWHAIWAYVCENHPQPIEDERTAEQYVLALFPQPTPSADQIISLCPRCGGSGCVGLADCRLCWGSGEVSNPAPPAEPVSTADMAPGTTLIARPAGEGTEEARFRVLPGGRLAIEGWRLTGLHVSDLDPSTIRDVTPPKGVQ